MPGRNIPSGLLASLRSPTVRLCVCVKVTRQDGQVFAFTTHDRQITLDGVGYEASSAFQSTNVRQEAGGSVDNVDVTGILSSSRITAEDLRAGAFDNADVTMSLCDWSDTSLGSVVLLRGSIGDISMGDGSYTASFRSLAQRLQQQVGELYSPTCRVFRLGDGRCKFNLAGNTADGYPATSNVEVSSVSGQTVLEIAGGVPKVGYYNYGQLVSASGRNTGYAREVKLHGEGSGLVTATASPTGVPTGGLSFKRSYNYTPSVSLTFAIPAGTWEGASMVVTSNWHIIDVTRLGTDQLTVQFPPGHVNDVVVRSNSRYVGPVSYNDTLQFGDTTMAAINAAAGGAMTMALRHTQASSEDRHWFTVDVSSVVLTLFGPGGGTSSRLVLHEAFPYPVAAGDVFQAVAGCNRLSATCTQKFSNIVNFRGEPTLPGTEKLLERGRPPS